MSIECDLIEVAICLQLSGYREHTMLHLLPSISNGQAVLQVFGTCKGDRDRAKDVQQQCR